MKLILLKLFLVFIFVCIPVSILIYFSHKDYLERLPATPEQLTAIVRTNPCAVEEFQQVLTSKPEPLSLRNATKLASDCSERTIRTEEKRKRENEINEFHEKQLKALGGINK